MDNSPDQNKKINQTISEKSLYSDKHLMSFESKSKAENAYQKTQKELEQKEEKIYELKNNSRWIIYLIRLSTWSIISSYQQPRFLIIHFFNLQKMIQDLLSIY